jgi:stage II sporulation protein D
MAPGYPDPFAMVRLACLTLLACLLAAAPAAADDRTSFTIRGAGFGHGVGMSQYGAYGFALHGKPYDAILRHYYRGTQLGSADGRTVRVLLQSTGTARFSGAARAGSRALDPGRTYLVRARSASEVDLLSSAGRRIATFTAPLQVGGDAPVQLGGSGAYRGLMEFRPAGSGVNAINAVSLEDYVAGVVARESPS